MLPPLSLQLLGSWTPHSSAFSRNWNSRHMPQGRAMPFKYQSSRWYINSAIKSSTKQYALISCCSQKIFTTWCGFCHPSSQNLRVTALLYWQPILVSSKSYCPSNGKSELHPTSQNHLPPLVFLTGQSRRDRGIHRNHLTLFSDKNSQPQEIAVTVLCNCQLTQDRCNIYGRSFNGSTFQGQREGAQQVNALAKSLMTSIQSLEPTR